MPEKMTFVGKYMESIEKLLNGGGIAAETIYNYKDEDYAEIFGKLFYFAQVNLDDYSGEWAISPAFFYYADDNEVNARADRSNRRYLISINRGTIEKLFEQFFNQNLAFQKDGYLKNNYSDFLPGDVTPDYILYQAPALFTYFHEHGHLIQRSPDQYFSEASKGAPGPYNQYSHVLEFDADEHAAKMVFEHLIYYWENSVVPEFRTADSVRKILALAIAGIMTYLSWLYDEELPLYFKEGTHPHPLNRTLYIIDMLGSFAEQHFKHKFDTRELLREGFKVAELTAKGNGLANPTHQFAIQYQANADEMDAFVNDLIERADNTPNLCRHRRKEISQSQQTTQK